MRILILGGTLFLGRHLAAEADARGYKLSLFHRGQTGAGLFADKQHLFGDRTGDLAALRGGAWDAVIDTSGYFPGVVAKSAEVLAPHVSTYVFISSISVYQDFTAPGIDEDHPVQTLAPEAPRDQMTPAAYGPLKALCEEAVRGAFGARAVIVRPGLIVGPHDPTDRFTYWVRRLATRGRALLPGDGRRLVQFIDARDLAMFILDLAEQGAGGTYNATGRPVSFGDFAAAAQAGLGDAFAAEPEWVSESFLEAHGIQGWTELPMWLRGADQTVAVHRAESAGLNLQSAAATVRATHLWDQTRLPFAAMKTGLSLTRERELLAAWAAAK